MVSYSDALKMMQGGEDRTGYADMIDTLGSPGDLLAQRRAEAEQRRSLMELLSSQGGDEIIGGDISGGDEGNGFSFSGAFDKAKTSVDDFTDSFLTSEGQDLKDTIVGKSGDFLKSVYDIANDPANIVGPNLSLSIAEALGLEQKPDPNKDPIVINIDDIMNQAKDYVVDSDAGQMIGQGVSTGYDMFKDKFLSPYFNYFADEEEDINSNIFGPAVEYADGGRVGMQQGGVPTPALLGTSSGSLGFAGGQQNMSDFANFQDAMYRPPLNRPPMQGDPGYDPTPGPGYIQPMPFQPSPMQSANYDVADYLGSNDPFAAVYDPYVNATGTGAYDQYGMGMTQEDINKVFADTDKFSLAAQEAKRKAAEAAAAAARRQQQNTGGGGHADGKDK